MAYLVTQRVGGKAYYQLRESYRDSKGKVRQRVLAHLGTDFEAARRRIAQGQEEAAALLRCPTLVTESPSQRIARAKELNLTRPTATASGGAAEVLQGDWWQLGPHCLYCGDTASDEFIKGLPDASFAFADPPYNEAVADWDKAFVWKHDWLAQKADIVAVTPGIGAIPSFMRLTDMPYKWSACCWITNGMTRGEMGFGNWIYVALFSSKSIYRTAQDLCRVKGYDLRTKVTIDISTTGQTRHKGRKPIMLLSWLLRTFTKRGDPVIDPFLGSGTTLFAADQEGRCCYGGELVPEFCQEIISRWNQDHPAELSAHKIQTDPKTTSPVTHPTNPEKRLLKNPPLGQVCIPDTKHRRKT